MKYLVKLYIYGEPQEKLSYSNKQDAELAKKNWELLQGRTAVVEERE